MWMMLAVAMAAPQFVQASSLKLRASPAATGKPVGTLTINSPVEVLATSGDFVQVRVANGKEGWVATAFLSPERLTLAAARAHAEAQPDQALSWLQRAAAIAPADREVLTALASAYQATGQSKAASQIEAQLAWPHQVFVVARSHRWRAIGDGVVVQWSMSAEPFTDQILTPAQREKRGIPEQGWWVLPDVGEPVPATLREVWAGYHNECAGTETVEVVLDAKLPEGRVALAAARGEVPASWHVTSPLPSVPKAEALAIVAAHAAVVGKGHETVLHGVSWDGQRWIGRILFGIGGPGETLSVVEGAVMGDRFELLKPEGDVVFDSFLEIGRRDIDGDGDVDRVLGDGCMTILVGPDGGDWERLTDSWCCGC